MRLVLAAFVFLMALGCDGNNPAVVDEEYHPVHRITIANENYLKAIVCVYKVDTVSYLNHDTLWHDTLGFLDETDTISMASDVLYRIVATSFPRVEGGITQHVTTEIPAQYRCSDPGIIRYTFQGDSLTPVMYHP